MDRETIETIPTGKDNNFMVENSNKIYCKIPKDF